MVTAQRSKLCRTYNHYGDFVLSKLECVNHDHKRMGSALCKLTKQEKLGGQGEGRLTADKCNVLQSYYRIAIQNNRLQSRFISTITTISE